MATRTMNGHMTGDEARAHGTKASMGTGHYARFAFMIFLSFIAMYVFMYSMVNGFSNVYHNVNQFYMAGLMAAPMAIIEILLMRSMYPNTRLNYGILVISVLALGLFWIGIRHQVAVGDKQFVRSMIPHHSGAILMCREAKIQDAELQQLCGRIIQSQQDEIDQMERILKRLD